MLYGKTQWCLWDTCGHSWTFFLGMRKSAVFFLFVVKFHCGTSFVSPNYFLYAPLLHAEDDSAGRLSVRKEIPYISSVPRRVVYMVFHQHETQGGRGVHLRVS
jgi:hypothetical protein